MPVVFAVLAAFLDLKIQILLAGTLQLLSSVTVSSTFLSVHKEESILYIEEILALESHEDFVKLVDKWRTQGMHNDDSTLIIVQSDTDNIIIKEYFDRVNH